MKKSKLRKIFLKKQSELSETERRDRSLQITGSVFAQFPLEIVRYLHLFLSIAEKGEIDTSAIISKLWREHPSIKTVVPRVNFEKDVLEHLEFDRNTTLQTSSWGIAEPVGNKLIEEKKIDMVLVPMLCFDERGYRVGHGKGYYDKFLSKCREDVLKIGLSFFPPVERIEDIWEEDVKLDHCVTPGKVWHFK
ncbi:MAG: 5-formyltetrahydrofolate cyclo-ligase [Pyrinomonadaceae bacterium]